MQRTHVRLQGRFLSVLRITGEREKTDSGEYGQDGYDDYELDESESETLFLSSFRQHVHSLLIFKENI